MKSYVFMNKKPHIVMSIKPEYVEKIFSGEKRWEFRKSFPVLTGTFSDQAIVHIYETAPVSKIVGEFSVGKILYNEPILRVWTIARDHAGITYLNFLKYFTKNFHSLPTVATAIGVVNPLKYPTPRELFDYGLVMPPQSYCFAQTTPENE